METLTVSELASKLSVPESCIQRRVDWESNATHPTLPPGHAFLTGSFAYGTPHAGSDVDLVVLMTVKEANRLCGLPGCVYTPNEYGAPVIRFGNLNIIAVSSIEEWTKWKDGTDELISRRPVSRDEAKRVLRRYCGQDECL